MSDHHPLCERSRGEYVCICGDLNELDAVTRADERGKATVHSTGTDTGGPCCECCYAMVDLEEMLDVLADVIGQACGDGNDLDSMALSAYADGMRLLARYGRLRINHEAGRRVIGQWVTADG